MNKSQRSFFLLLLVVLISQRILICRVYFQAGPAPPGSQANTPSNNPPQAAAPQKIDSIKNQPTVPETPDLPVPEVVDTFYFDSFYFLGRHDSGVTLCHFSFQQSAEPGKPNSAKFVGSLSWKKNWFGLEPAGEFPLESPEPHMIPAHPAYDFNWPTSAGKGEFYYHFGQVYLSVVFNELLPVYRINKSIDNKSDIFICNALLQGKENEIKGILLYHRLRVHQVRKVVHQDDIGRMMVQSPRKFLYLNSNHFETFLIWIGYPFPGKGPERFALKINRDGEISSTTREIDFTAGMEYLTGQVPLFWGGEFIVPDMGLNFILRTFSRSEKIDHKVFYNVEGVFKNDSTGRKLIGLLMDHRPEIEHSPNLNQAGQTLNPAGNNTGSGADDPRLKNWKSRKKKKSKKSKKSYSKILEKYRDNKKNNR